MQTIYKDSDGYFVVEGIGNRIYLPDVSMQSQECADFLSDYFVVAINDTTV